MLPDVIDSFTSEGVILQLAEGGRAEIKYRDLVKVTIDTNDQGPVVARLLLVPLHAREVRDDPKRRPSHPSPPQRAPALARVQERPRNQGDGVHGRH